MSRETRHLWVGNIPENIREDKLVEHFKRFGRIENVKILPKRSSDGTLSAFVDFVDIKCATKAHESDNTLGDRELRTDYNEPDRPPGTVMHIHEHEDSPTQHMAMREFGGSYQSRQSRYAREGYTDERNYEHPAYAAYDRSLYERHYEQQHPTTSYYDDDEIAAMYYPVHTSRRKTYVRSAYTQQKRTASAYSAPGYSKFNKYEQRQRTEEVDPSVETRGRNKHKKTHKSKHGKKQSLSGSGSHSRSQSVSGSRSRSPSKSHSQSGSDSSSESRSQSRSSDSSDSRGSSISSRGSALPRSPSASSHSSNTDMSGKRSTALCVKNLPTRSTDTSLKDGLFHEFKKHGTILAVRVQGNASDRFGLIFFKRAEDVQKAIDKSKGKLFFGSEIDISIWSGPVDIEVDGDLRLHEEPISRYHSKASRTLFIGNLEKTTSYSDLREKFKAFGDIVNIDIKKQGGLPAYAFMQFANIKSVVKSLKKMDGEPLGKNRFKLGFGKSMPNNCLWVEGIAQSITETALARYYSRFGVITRCDIDRKGELALVYFDDVENAQFALNETKGRKLTKKRLQVDFASVELQNNFYENLKRSGQTVGERRDVTHYTRCRETREATSTQYSTYYKRDANYHQFQQSGRYPEEYYDYDEWRRNYEEEYSTGSGASYRDVDDSYEQELREYGYRQRERREQLHREQSPVPTRERVLPLSRRNSIESLEVKRRSLTPMSQSRSVSPHIKKKSKSHKIKKEKGYTSPRQTVSHSRSVTPSLLSEHDVPVPKIRKKKERKKLKDKLEQGKEPKKKSKKRGRKVKSVIEDDLKISRNIKIEIVNPTKSPIRSTKKESFSLKNDVPSTMRNIKKEKHSPARSMKKGTLSPVRSRGTYSPARVKVSLSPAKSKDIDCLTNTCVDNDISNAKKKYEHKLSAKIKKKDISDKMLKAEGRTRLKKHEELQSVERQFPVERHEFESDHKKLRYDRDIGKVAVIEYEEGERQKKRHERDIGKPAVEYEEGERHKKRHDRDIGKPAVIEYEEGERQKKRRKLEEYENESVKKTDRKYNLIEPVKIERRMIQVKPIRMDPEHPNKETKPIRMDPEYPRKETKPIRMDPEYPRKETKPIRMDPEYPRKETKPIRMDPEYPCKETKPIRTDPEHTRRETIPIRTDPEYPRKETKPIRMDPEHPHKETKPITIDPEQQHKETKPIRMDPEHPRMETKPIGIDPEHARKETKPIRTDPEHARKETKPIRMDPELTPKETKSISMAPELTGKETKPNRTDSEHTHKETKLCAQLAHTRVMEGNCDIKTEPVTVCDKSENPSVENQINNKPVIQEKVRIGHLFDVDDDNPSGLELSRRYDDRKPEDRLAAGFIDTSLSFRKQMEQRRKLQQQQQQQQQNKEKIEVNEVSPEMFPMKHSGAEVCESSTTRSSFPDFSHKSFLEFHHQKRKQRSTDSLLGNEKDVTKRFYRTRQVSDELSSPKDEKIVKEKSRNTPENLPNSPKHVNQDKLTLPPPAINATKKGEKTQDKTWKLQPLSSDCTDVKKGDSKSAEQLKHHQGIAHKHSVKKYDNMDDWELITRVKAELKQGDNIQDDKGEKIKQPIKHVETSLRPVSTSDQTPDFNRSPVSVTSVISSIASLPMMPTARTIDIGEWSKFGRIKKKSSVEMEQISSASETQPSESEEEVKEMTKPRVIRSSIFDQDVARLTKRFEPDNEHVYNLITELDSPTKLAELKFRTKAAAKDYPTLMTRTMPSLHPQTLSVDVSPSEKAPPSLSPNSNNTSIGSTSENTSIACPRASSMSFEHDSAGDIDNLSGRRKRSPSPPELSPQKVESPNQADESSSRILAISKALSNPPAIITESQPMGTSLASRREYYKNKYKVRRRNESTASETDKSLEDRCNEARCSVTVTEQKAQSINEARCSVNVTEQNAQSIKDTFKSETENGLKPVLELAVAKDPVVVSPDLNTIAAAKSQSDNSKTNYAPQTDSVNVTDKHISKSVEVTASIAVTDTDNTKSRTKSRQPSQDRGAAGFHSEDGLDKGKETKSKKSKDTGKGKKKSKLPSVDFSDSDKEMVEVKKEGKDAKNSPQLEEEKIKTTKKDVKGKKGTEDELLCCKEIDKCKKSKASEKEQAKKEDSGKKEKNDKQKVSKKEVKAKNSEVVEQPTKIATSTIEEGVIKKSGDKGKRGKKGREKTKKELKNEIEEQELLVFLEEKAAEEIHEAMMEKAKEPAPKRQNKAKPKKKKVPTATLR